MLQNTRGIVLRTVKYGETSVIASIYTEKFGIQSYLVNGVRKTSKKGSTSAGLFQPSANLDLVVYYNDLKQLHRIKEYKWGQLYENIFFDVKKNAVALFMVEILQKCFKQPEQNEDLFYFIEDCFLKLDKSDDSVVGNFPLFFLLHLAVFFGFRIEDNFNSQKNILDLQEGEFTTRYPPHSYYLEGQLAETISHLLKVMQPEELKQVKLNQHLRRQLLQAFEDFYRLHLPDFGTLKSLPVLQELLN
jgi:DNA repair protein RecO (recombination protein O)